MQNKGKKKENLTILSVDKDEDTCNSHILLGGALNYTLENGLAISYKIKSTSTVWLSNTIFRHFPKRNKHLCPYKELHIEALFKKPKASNNLIIHGYIYR